MMAKDAEVHAPTVSCVRLFLLLTYCDPCESQDQSAAVKQGRSPRDGSPTNIFTRAKSQGRNNDKLLQMMMARDHEVHMPSSLPSD